MNLAELQDVTAKALQNLNEIQSTFDAFCSVELGMCINSNKAPNQSVVRSYRELLARLTAAQKEFFQAQEASSQAFKAKYESSELETSRD